MADDGTVAKRIQGKRKSIQKAAKEHAKKDKERQSNIAVLRAAYAQEKDGVVLTDILAKAAQFQKYHLKLAQDGVGARKTGHKLVDGTEEVENFFLDNHQRAGHLDKASGIQELVDYINRTINPPTANPQPKPVAPQA